MSTAAQDPLTRGCFGRDRRHRHPYSGFAPASPSCAAGGRGTLGPRVGSANTPGLVAACPGSVVPTVEASALSPFPDHPTGGQPEPASIAVGSGPGEEVTIRRSTRGANSFPAFPPHGTGVGIVTPMNMRGRPRDTRAGMTLPAGSTFHLRRRDDRARRETVRSFLRLSVASHAFTERRRTGPPSNALEMSPAQRGAGRAIDNAG